MPKRETRRVVLSDFKAKKRDEGAIEIEAEDGTVFRIDPPALWPDDALVLAKEKRAVELATLLLGGEDGYRAFVAAGGSAALLDAIIGEELGARAGE